MLSDEIVEMIKKYAEENEFEFRDESNGETSCIMIDAKFIYDGTYSLGLMEDSNDSEKLLAIALVWFKNEQGFRKYGELYAYRNNIELNISLKDDDGIMFEIVAEVLKSDVICEAKVFNEMMEELRGAIERFIVGMIVIYAYPEDFNPEEDYFEAKLAWLVEGSKGIYEEILAERGKNIEKLEDLKD